MSDVSKAAVTIQTTSGDYYNVGWSYEEAVDRFFGVISTPCVEFPNILMMDEHAPEEEGDPDDVDEPTRLVRCAIRATSVESVSQIILPARHLEEIGMTIAVAKTDPALEDLF